MEAERARAGEGIIPHLTITGGKAAAAIDFYKQAFGATEVARMPEENGARLMHAHLQINGGSIMLADEFPEYSGAPAGVPEGVTLHLQVDDADRWFERAVDAGAAVRMKIGDQFWGDRYGQVQDPFGHRWSIGSPITR